MFWTKCKSKKSFVGVRICVGADMGTSVITSTCIGAGIGVGVRTCIM